MSDDIRDDLAYVKALAEEGRDTPLVNGVFYVIWGSAVGLAAIATYLGHLELPVFKHVGGFAPFIFAFVVGWALSLYFGRKSSAKPGASTLGNRTAQSVWMAVGIVMSGLWISLFFFHDNYTHVGVPPYFLFNLMFPVAFAVYGIAFYATAVAARVEWLRWFAVTSWVVSLACLGNLASVNQLLLGGFGSLICATVPGVMLMRNEPSEVV